MLSKLQAPEYLIMGGSRDARSTATKRPDKAVIPNIGFKMSIRFPLILFVRSVWLLLSVKIPNTPISKLSQPNATAVARASKKMASTPIHPKLRAISIA